LILLNTNGLLNVNLLDGIQKVLDVGTGTGELPIEFADKHPSAIVEALEVSPNVMPTNFHPNCTFFI
jgi:precorrin-6B methylase 2